jgi:hypothetical protein
MQQQTKQPTAEQKLAAALKEVEALKAKVKAQKKLQKKKAEEPVLVLFGDNNLFNGTQLLKVRPADLERLEKWNNDGYRGVSWLCLSKEQATPLNLKESAAWMDKEFIGEGYNWRTDEVSDSDDDEASALFK